jgi:hypothetical protein
MTARMHNGQAKGTTSVASIFNAVPSFAAAAVQTGAVGSSEKQGSSRCETGTLPARLASSVPSGKSRHLMYRLLVMTGMNLRLVHCCAQRSD